MKCENLKGCCSGLDELRCRLAGVFLLAVRIIWGWRFFQGGLGKFQNYDKTAEFFTSLNLPWAKLQVCLVGTIEMFGGLLLLLGLGSRIVPFPLIVVMIGAYYTAHNQELTNLINDFDSFASAPPFLFLMASLIVWFFGSGKYSFDAIFCKRCKKE